MTHNFFNNINVGGSSKLVVNGQVIETNGGPVSISTVNGVTTVTTGEAVKAPEPFKEDVPRGESKKLSGMGQKVNCALVEGTLVVDGMNAEIVIGTLNGALRVEGMSADVEVGFMGPDSILTVDGMNATVEVIDAVIGAVVDVSGMSSRLNAPATIATTCEVNGMNSKMKFH